MLPERRKNFEFLAKEAAVTLRGQPDEAQRLRTYFMNSGIGLGVIKQHWKEIVDIYMEAQNEQRKSALYGLDDTQNSCSTPPSTPRSVNAQSDELAFSKSSRDPQSKPTTMLIFSPEPGKWDGVCCDYGDKEENCIAPQIIKRHGLESRVENLRIKILCKEQDFPTKTYLVLFRIQPDLHCDILLGTKWSYEDGDLDLRGSNGRVKKRKRIHDVETSRQPRALMRNREIDDLAIFGAKFGAQLFHENRRLSSSAIIAPRIPSAPRHHAEQVVELRTNSESSARGSDKIFDNGHSSQVDTDDTSPDDYDPAQSRMSFKESCAI